MPGELSIRSPWRKKFATYLLERFPPVQVLLFLILYMAIIGYASFLNHPLKPVEIGWKSIPGFLALIFFFFHLRVFDEYKDYSEDLINHPYRVLQSGLITLAQLRIVAVLGIMIQIGISLWYSATVLFYWSLAFGYSLLMAKEFFVGVWLSGRRFLYALSHLLVIHFIVVWIASTVQLVGVLPEKILLLSFSAFFYGLALEVSRKIRLPSEESDTLSTYSQLLGPKRASLLALAAMIAAGVFTGFVLFSLEMSIIYYLALAMLLVACGILQILFIVSQTASTIRWLELSASLFMLGSYLIILAATWMKAGIEWS